MATYLPSQKSSNLDEQNLHKTGREVRTNSLGTFSYGLLNLDTPVLVKLKRRTYIIYRQTLDVALTIYNVQ